MTFNASKKVEKNGQILHTAMAKIFENGAEKRLNDVYYGLKKSVIQSITLLRKWDFKCKRTCAKALGSISRLCP